MDQSVQKQQNCERSPGSGLYMIMYDHNELSSLHCSVY